jgi:SAM-dependent methyltransferase
LVVAILYLQGRKVLEITDKSKAAKYQSIGNPVFSGSQQLFDSEIGLTRYSTDIVSKFYELMNLENLVIQNKGKFLEFGAGTGFLAQLFVNNFGIRPECVELDPVLAKLNLDRGFKCFRFLKDTAQNYDAIYTSNVLEHIEDDQVALSDLHSSLVSGGWIAIYVPAHSYLFTQMDLEVGHVRRYSRSELKKKVLQAGFEIKVLNYNDSLGFFATLLVKVMGYREKANLGSPKSLLFYDKYVFPISRFLDHVGFRFLVGKNLILIARKP